LASLKRVYLPAIAVPVIGLDDVEPLHAKVDAVGAATVGPSACLLVGDFEIAREDRSPFEGDTLDGRQRSGAAARVQILRDQALRILRASGNGRAADQQRGNYMAQRHVSSPPPSEEASMERPWERINRRSSKQLRRSQRPSALETTWSTRIWCLAVPSCLGAASPDWGDRRRAGCSTRAACPFRAGPSCRSP